MLMNLETNRGNGNEEDAMFTKKHLGPVNCASCEKNVVNLEGRMADFLPWKRLPFKEPGERISKYGPGFSKILQMLRPERSVDAMSSPDPHHFKRTSVNEFVEDIDHGGSPKYPDSSIISSPVHQSSYHNHHRHAAHLQISDPILPRAVTQHQSNSVGLQQQTRTVTQGQF
jgi:hypothetical protein